MTLVPLVEAAEAGLFGGKAVALGVGLRAGLPVPDGFAIAWQNAEMIAHGHHTGLASLLPDHVFAVRSSAVGEDSTTASYAGAHLTVLGVTGATEVARAVTDVHDSMTTAGALAYRRGLGLGTTTRMGVVVQELVDADVSGVMFTRNPATGTPERVIEASWGLGEAVVGGLVTPDRYVLDASGQLADFTLGEKDLAIEWSRTGTVEVPVTGQQRVAACLGDTELAALHELADACSAAYGSTDHDIEFAFACGAVVMLQRRPITGPRGRQP